MKNKFIKSVFYKLTIIIMTTLTIEVNSQTSVGNETTFSMSEKESAVNSISKLMIDNYVFADVGLAMEKKIKEQFAAGEYTGITDPQKFADELTEDLQSVSKDKHIRVLFNPAEIKKLRESGQDKADEDYVSPEMIQMLKMENYGFRKAERLSGNIGYIDFRNFGPGEVIKDKVADVMGFVQDCDAIIFDMRYNGGGDPTGVQLITSYLFGEEPVHLNDLYYRPNDTTKEYWTLKDIKGKRMPDVPVYILTSSFTFSGAEEFTYNLKNLKRAAIVGETTGGGANPGGTEIADDNFAVFVPTGRAINPITKTNWEGTGVTPDIEINSIDALTKAHILALDKISQNSKAGNENLKWLSESLNATLNDIDIEKALMEEYAGNYGERKIFIENDKLYYQRINRPKFEMTPMGEDTFMFKELEYFRIKFSKDENGKVNEIIGFYDNGKTDSSKKDL